LCLLEQLRSPEHSQKWLCHEYLAPIATLLAYCLTPQEVARALACVRQAGLCFVAEIAIVGAPAKARATEAAES